MKYLLTYLLGGALFSALYLSLALLLGACENPISHITDPDKGKTITIDRCSVDTLPNGDPVPPGYQDTTVCKR